MNYFDLYYAYLAQCERENWINNIDPHHYKMEWNHTLPQCIFGDLLFGQWLTLKQHAIASALQTLAFQRNCLCGWHKKYLPSSLWDTCLPLYSRLCTQTLAQLTTDQLRRGSTNPNSGLKSFREKYAIFKYNGEERTEINRKGGLSVFKNKVGIFAPENLGKGAATTNAQLWVSTLDGFVSTAAGVASHNRSVGGTGREKIKLPNNK